MQQRGCEAIQVLLSKYADNETTLAEHEQVMAHVAVCDDCAHRLAEYEQVSALFRAELTRQADPSLRVGLFKEITHIKEEERRREREVARRHWYLPSSSRHTRRKSPLERAWNLASPFVAASLAVFGLIGITLVINRSPSPSTDEQSKVAEPVYQPVPTVLATIALASLMGSDADGVNPPPVGTRAADATFLPAYAGGVVVPDSGSDGVLTLSRATPFLENDARGEWHVVRDATYGYSLAYPPNWWTQVEGNKRYFRPWSPGGAKYVPYWIELQVQDNTQHLNAESANRSMFDGRGTRDGNSRLRHFSSDPQNAYDELYNFDAQHVYMLRLVVPQQSAAGEFQPRWDQAQAIFSRMSGKTYHLQETPQVTSSPSGYGPVLFLNGDDLWAVDQATGRTYAITQGGFKVRQFALSPDMKSVAFISAKTGNDTWAKTLYVVDLAANSSESPVLLWDDIDDIHDLAWYSDHLLVTIARTPRDGLGIFTVSLPAHSPTAANVSIERIAPLDQGMVGAKGLAVSPDRQILTFMAPLGESMGTDIYAIRPDGTDLKLLVSHAAPLSPSSPAGRVLAPEGQAVKSYVWTDGYLDFTGYRYNLLFTCGNVTSPTYYRGGFLYSAPGASRGTVLDNNRLGISDPTKLQIIHIAYSSNGKLAMTGYYNDRVAGRADQLAGLWVADFRDGALSNLVSMPIPAAPHGITDLQWAPDGRSLIYRETMPRDTVNVLSAGYYISDPFAIVKLDTVSRAQTVLYAGGPH